VDFYDKAREKNIRPIAFASVVGKNTKRWRDGEEQQREK
jgi:hypothetical protein